MRRIGLLEEVRVSLHPPNLSLALVLLEPLVQMLPPFEEHRLANELEPRRELQSVVLEHRLQFLLRDVGSLLDLIGIDLEVDIGLDEENVID